MRLIEVYMRPNEAKWVPDHATMRLNGSGAQMELIGAQMRLIGAQMRLIEVQMRLIEVQVGTLRPRSAH